ncbi:S-layer homology domain-containing protein [Sporosarcina sp. HYO08]|uniref:S-layer homology domain-containing protein n=1 Tax=Sporosarcina sp. HYO08 TaxID=1759557 RepID=UPI00079860BA|nr:S-layer homology domain-containing protein [Sporosarcina sp. HYO08]KXH87245.1 hypothetical protein AU377_01340 [Sporosarcina sp. HYO08]
MKGIRILLALCLVFGLFAVSPASAAVKPTERYWIGDIGPDHRFYDSIERFINMDIIDGYVETEVYEEDGEVYEDTYVTVRPDEKVTRAQFTKILVNALSLQEEATAKTFPDVKQGKWYYDYVRIASSQGIITGHNDGKFHPDDNITRDQMAVMIYRAFKNTVPLQETMKTFKDVPASSFAYEAIAKLAATGIVQGYGDTFKPHNLSTRGQAITLIDRAMNQETGTSEDGQAVTAVVDRNIQEELRLTQEANTPALEALYHETATGYHLSYSLESLGIEEDMEELDGDLSIESISDYSLHAVAVNKRLAEVRVDNLKYKVSLTSPDLSFSITVDASGTAYLKKDADGKWKIYNLVLDEDLEDEWQEEISTAANES